ELATVDTVSFAHGADCADGISCQQVEVAGVAGAALTARLTHAALVERGDRESAGYDRQRIDHGAADSAQSSHIAPVARWIEERSPKARVGGSIPPRGTVPRRPNRRAEPAAIIGLNVVRLGLSEEVQGLADFVLIHSTGQSPTGWKRLVRAL